MTNESKAIANTATVQAIYSAFARGDVAAIQECVTESTHWSFNGASEHVSWHQEVNGRAEVPRFFAAIGANADFAAFDPRVFVSEGSHVVVRLHLDYTVRSTGKRVDEEQVHWWTFDATGKVESMMHFEDTAQVIAANRS